MHAGKHPCAAPMQWCHDTMKFTTVKVVAVILLLSGCAGIPPTDISVPPYPLVKYEEHENSFLADDLDDDSLVRAIDFSLEYYRRLPDDMAVKFGGERYTVADLKESLEIFRAIVTAGEEPGERWRRIEDSFDFYRASGRTGKGDVLITGYYAPVLEGSLTQTPEYRYPIFRRPDDHIMIDLGKFDRSCTGERLTARVENGQALPYYTRRNIDIEGCLDGRGYEIAWLADPVDVFFLHIQGSGIIRLPDGSSMYVSYACANGRPYRSIGKLLIDSGKLTSRETTMQRIKQYLREHPDEMEDVLAHNESYVFFRIVGDGPRGSLDVPVTEGRSIATDASLFPRGALAFIEARKPVADDAGNIVSWIPFSRFVLNQDAGGAIKGAGRVDLFCGDGDYAELMAGNLKESGALYFLVMKKPRVSD